MRWNFFVGLMVAGMSGAGCSNESQDVLAPAPLPTANAALNSGASDEVLDEDTLGEQAYARLLRASAEQQAGSMSVSVYALHPLGEPAGRVRERARLLGLEQAPMRQSDRGVAVMQGSRELHVDAVSGTERYVDHSRFHLGQGVPVLPMTQTMYITLARSHVQRALPDVAARNLRPYRVRRYMNESAGPGGVRTGAQVYQVAVAFHELLGDLPVIGPGGKVAVHLTPEGEVISHESTVRVANQRLAGVSGVELLPPDEARRRVEARLTAEGVRLADYTLKRAEFGYFRLGRNSVQTVLAPHYAYIYEPRSPEVLGKKRAEFIPAITDPALLARLRQDEQAEAARKASRMARASEEDSK
jgi:hypothetical protein